MITRAKPYRLPVAIFQRETAENMYLFCLPSAGRDALLANSERLLWDAVWIGENGERVGLDDSQRSIMEETIAQLCEGVSMDDLIAILTKINQTIESKNLNVCVECGTMCNCGCGGSSQQQNNQQTIQEIYQQLNQEDLDWLIEILCSVESQPVNDYKCQAANWIFDGWIDTNNEFRESNELGGLTAAIVEAIIKAKKWIVKGLGIYLAIVEWMISFFSDNVAQGFAEVLLVNRQAFVNAMYSGTAPSESRALAMAVMEGANTNVVYKTYFQTVYWAATDWNLLYIDNGTVPADYPVTTPCSYNPPVDLPDGYYLKPWPQQEGSTGEGGSVSISGDNQNIVQYILDDDGGGGTQCSATTSATEAMPATGVGFYLAVTWTSTNPTYLRFNEGTATIYRLDLSLDGQPPQFNMRGRLASETGLTDWVNATEAQFRTPDMAPEDVMIQLLETATLVESYSVLNVEVFYVDTVP